MSRRFQFSLRALFVAMLAVACFFGGIRFERERQRRQDEADALAEDVQIDDLPLISLPDQAYWDRIKNRRSGQ